MTAQASPMETRSIRTIGPTVSQMPTTSPGRTRSIRARRSSASPTRASARNTRPRPTGAGAGWRRRRWERDRRRRERVARNTAIFSIATGVSRVGLAREIVAASFFGTGGPASAFTIAFQIPNLASNLFANAALSAAFVPVFTDLLQQGRRREAFRLASTLFWIILIVLGAIAALFILAAGLIMPLFTGPTFNAPLDAFTAGFSQILFPVVLLIGLRPVRWDPAVLRTFHDPCDRPRGVEPRDHRAARRAAPALSRRL